MGGTMPTVGLICREEALVEIVGRALVGRVELRRLPAAVEKLDGLDALILVFEKDLLGATIELLAVCLEDRPQLNVLGISDLEANWIVELLRCGMTDHLTPPIDERLLQRKVERMVLRGAGTVLEVPAFAHLPRTRGWSVVPNARAAGVRATVSTDYPASLSLVAAGEAAPQLPIVDVSVLTGARAGGLSLRVEAKTEAGAPFLRMTPGSSSAARLHLPKSLAREPIPARIKLVGVLKPSPMTHGETWYAFQYWLDRSRDEAVLQQFWMRSQMLERAQAQARLAG